MMSTLQISAISMVTIIYRSQSLENLPILRYSLGWNPLFAELIGYAP